MTEDKLERILHDNAVDYFEPHNCYEGISFVAHIVMMAINEEKEKSGKWYEFWKWNRK